MKMDRRNNIGKTTSSLVRETPMLVMMRIWIYLLTKGYIHTTTSLHLINLGIKWDKQLPPKEAFYSNLTESHIEDDEYEWAQKIWEHVGIRNLGQYHDLYLRTDVLLLTDVSENFRDLCLEYYGLDPAHYFTLPNFAWDAMLLKTGVEIDPLTDQEMYEMIEKW